MGAGAKAQVNIRLHAEVRSDAERFAKDDGHKLAGWIDLLVRREVEQRRAQALAATPRGPQLGQARNVTTRLLTGQCLHPIHQREQLPLHDRCAAPGCGATFPRSG